MFMSMEWDYLSELRLPIGILFIPQETYEYGGPQWSDIKTVKLLIRPSETSGSCTNSHLIANQEKHGE
jgi:hypothetical protein